MTQVVIVGGGPAGLSCALVLQSALRHHPALDLAITVIDAGRSDLLQAELWNAAGIPLGTQGPVLLESLRAQLTHVHLVHERVNRLESVANTGFRLQGALGAEWLADFVVLATGYKDFQLDVTPTLVMRPHPNTAKPRPCLVLDDCLRADPHLYAAGLIAGTHSMFSSACGSGTEAACFLLSELLGLPTHVHDVPHAHG